MKTSVIRLLQSSRWILTLAATLLLATPALLPAQPQPDRPDGPPGAERRRLRQQPGLQPGGPQQGVPLMEQVLTEDQRESMRKAMETHRETLRGHQEKMRDARKALMNAALAEDFKEDVVHAKALEVAKLEADLTVMRLKALAEVQPALTKEQLEQLTNPQPHPGLAPGGNRPGPNNRRLNRSTGGGPDDEAMPRPPRRDPQ